MQARFCIERIISLRVICPIRIEFAMTRSIPNPLLLSSRCCCLNRLIRNRLRCSNPSLCCRSKLGRNLSRLKLSCRCCSWSSSFPTPNSCRSSLRPIPLQRKSLNCPATNPAGKFGRNRSFRRCFELAFRCLWPRWPFRRCCWSLHSFRSRSGSLRLRQ